MISVVIPALNEAENIEHVIALAASSPCVGEVIVIDDGSVDGTPEYAAAAGARVLTSTLLGKGASMEEGLAGARGDIIVYLDGDLRNLASDLVERLVEPLLDGRATFVKARFSRSAGRVTTLTAKPLIQTFFPELANFAQPLGGIIAVQRHVLEGLTFETDYGVDLALLIDAHFAGARIVEVDIGHITHDSQSLEALGEMAKQVARVLLHRAQRYDRLTIEQIREVEERERLDKSDPVHLIRKIDGVEKLALFDMDGTLLQGRAVVELARRTGKLAEISRYLDNGAYTSEERTQGIARCLAGVPRPVFQDVARRLPLTTGAVETVIALRKQGYRVGIVSDSFHVVTEIVRRRVFADFSIANVLPFRDGVATGVVRAAPLFLHPDGCKEHEACKRNVLVHLRERLHIPCPATLAVGDGENDICLLREANVGVAFEPKSAAVQAAADHVVQQDLRKVLPFADMAASSGQAGLASFEFEPACAGA